MNLPIALQLHSVREELSVDFEKTLCRVARMGYDGVEFAGLYGHSVTQIKALLKEFNLKAISAHVSIEEMAANPQEIFEDYAALGCQYVAIPYLDEHKRPGGVAYDDTLTAIRMLSCEAKNNGLQLLYHNHAFEFQRVEGAYLLDDLYAKTTPDQLATQLDVCWVHVGGEKPEEYLMKYAGRAPVIHLKNYAGDRTHVEMRTLNDGVVNIRAVLAAATEAGTHWVVVEQDHPTPGKTALTCAEESIRYLQTL